MPPKGKKLKGIFPSPVDFFVADREWRNGEKGEENLIAIHL